MSQPPLAYDDMDPSLQLFLLQLSVDTAVDPYEFADWIRNNLGWLRPGFMACDEPSDTDPRVENCQAVWLRTQFKQRQVAA